MSKLPRHCIVRFADNRPPEGESRLLGFANTGDDSPLLPDNAPEKEKNAGEQVSEMIASDKETLTAAVPEALIAGFSEVCASEETMQDVLNRPGVRQKEIQKILKETLGRDVDDNLEGIDTGQLSPEERRAAIAKILQAHPDVALHILESLESRIKQFDDLMLSLERRISIAINKKILLTEKQRKILGADSIQKLERMVETLEKIPTERINVVVGELQARDKGDLETTDIRAKLELPLPQTDTEQEGQETLLQFFLETKGTFHRRWKFGASQFFQRKNPDEGRYETAQTEYRTSLERHKHALREYVNTHITELAIKAAGECEKTVGAINERILGNESELTQEETNQKLLLREGYGTVALEDALDEYLEPLTRLGLGKGSKGRVKANSPEFPAYAKVALAVLLDRMPGGQGNLPGLLEQKKKEQRDIEAWAHATAKKLRRLHQLPDGRKKQAIVKFLRRNGQDWSLVTNLHDFFEPYAYHYDAPEERERYLEAHPERRICATDREFAPANPGDFEKRKKASERPTLRPLLTALLAQFEKDPEALLEAEEEMKAIDVEKKKLNNTGSKEIAAIMLKTRDHLTSVFEGIRQSPHLRHEVCGTIGLPGLLGEKQSAIESLIGVFDDAGNPIAAKEANATLPQAIREIQTLEETGRRLRGIDKNIVRKPIEDLKGYFQNGTIFINSSENEAEQALTLRHEEGHAVLWALEVAFPFLLSHAFERMKDRVNAESDETFEEILESLADFSSYKDITFNMDFYRLDAKKKANTPEEIEQETHRMYMKEMLDELLVRHADWKRHGKKERAGDEAARERVLFRMLEEGEPPFADESLDALSLLPVGGPRKAMRNDPRDGGDLLMDEEGAATAGQAEKGKETVNVHSELREIRREIEMTEAFIKAYGDDHPEVKEILGRHRENADTRYQELSKKFLLIDGNGGLPEDDPAFVGEVVALRKYTSTIKDFIEKADVKQLDISREKKSLKPGLLHGLRFASVLDVLKFCKDTWEDVTSIYTRRQDGLLKDIGAPITEALGIGKHLPIIGNYFAGVRGYHERRYSGTEKEAAQKWQDALNLVDSHDILHMIATTRNKDLVRGGISLLVERGEMDWNDPDVWKTLELMSGYKMPMDACLRDDVLRDTWLRKIINEIWHDKEQYYHWKQGNDANIKKHKDEFTPTVDTLANVSGRMANELRKQLMLFVEWQDAHRRGVHMPMPDDVKPHLYEEVLHYAIRNGRMRMEDKFFYLVQGVRFRLLSIDRLRVLAGEGGEILVRFPFIDYFNGKNNSYDEVKRLGERLAEKDDPFKPGAKTMCFLQYELPKSESFQQRLSKALSKDNIEKIDHEDFPMIVGQIDYSMINEITGSLSGDRFKISKESVKNSYVGFNTKFKAFANLVDAEEAKKARFTTYDAKSMAISVTSFLNFDNTITRKGWDGRSRQSLTWNDINNTTGPATGGMKVKIFRNAAYSFIHELLAELEGAGVFRWSDLEAKVANFKKENFLQNLGEEFQSTSTATDEQKASFNAIPHFQKLLEAAFQSRPDVLKHVLSKHGDRKRTHEHFLMEEGAGEKEYLTKEVTEEFFDELAAEERIGAEVHAPH